LAAIKQEAYHWGYLQKHQEIAHLRLASEKIKIANQ